MIHFAIFMLRLVAVCVGILLFAFVWAALMVAADADSAAQVMLYQQQYPPQMPEQIEPEEIEDAP